MSAFLQQAEANLSLLTAQLEGRRASPRRRALPLVPEEGAARPTHGASADHAQLRTALEVPRESKESQ